jgi:hypothetical protein
MTRLDTACRDIIAGVADGRTLPSNDSLVVQRPRYATGW